MATTHDIVWNDIDTAKIFEVLILVSFKLNTIHIYWSIMCCQLEQVFSGFFKQDNEKLLSACITADWLQCERVQALNWLVQTYNSRQTFEKYLVIQLLFWMYEQMLRFCIFLQNPKQVIVKTVFHKPGSHLLWTCYGSFQNVLCCFKRFGI